jgi:hypothetical protein
MMEKIGDSLAFKQAQNIVLQGFDPVSAGGFTQVPNVLLNDKDLTANAKLVYSKLLSYAWYNNMVFPGQERMAEEIGSSKSVVNRAVLELQKNGWLEIQRRGQGKTNVYVLKHTVTSKPGKKRG